MAEEKNKFWRSVIIVFGLVTVLWIIQLLQYYKLFDFSSFANHPRHIDGLKGIIFSPLIHAPNDFDHLISNTLPILILLTVLLNAYPKVALWVVVFVHLLSGILVWLFAPSDTYHIGISGIIYGIAFFLTASGIFRNDRNSVTIALFVTLIYGGMVLGFIPTKGVSWQSHLFGAISGVIIAFIFRKRDLPPLSEIEKESNEEDRHFFEEYPETEYQPLENSSSTGNIE